MKVYAMWDAGQYICSVCTAWIKYGNPYGATLETSMSKVFFRVGLDLLVFYLLIRCITAVKAKSK